jgi:hypothetical protein
MKFYKGPAPRRKSKPKPNVFDRIDAFLQLKAFISSGKAKPQEQAGITLDQYDGRKLGLKFPARAAADSLRRFVRSLGLEADYHVLKYETNEPGVWWIGVTYEPPFAGAIDKFGGQWDDRSARPSSR